MKGEHKSRSELKNIREEKQKDEQALMMIRNVCSAVIVMCVLTLLMFFLSGCKTQKAVEYRDSVRIEYKEILVPDTIIVEVPAEEKERETRDSTSILETSMAESLAKMTWKGGVPYLYHNLKNKPQKIKKVVYTKQRFKTIYRTRYVTRTKLVEKELSWWQKTQMIAGDVMLIALILVVGWQIVKRKFMR